MAASLVRREGRREAILGMERGDDLVLAASFRAASRVILDGDDAGDFSDVLLGDTAAVDIRRRDEDGEGFDADASRNAFLVVGEFLGELAPTFFNAEEAGEDLW